MTICFYGFLELKIVKLCSGRKTRISDNFRPLRILHPSARTRLSLVNTIDLTIRFVTENITLASCIPHFHVPVQLLPNKNSTVMYNILYSV